jgi:hypothetical protein
MEICTNFIFTHVRQTCFAYNFLCAFLQLFQRIQNLTYMLVVPIVAGMVWRTCTPTCLYILVVPVKARTLLDDAWSYL